jgi:hypothetical protein
VPKSPENLVERRVVQDLSFPRNDLSLLSVNDQIDIDNFRCDWGTFTDVKNIVMDAPLDAEAATLDVDSAFRCCPISPAKQHHFVIHWNDMFYINHNTPFGTTSSGSVFRRVADAMTAILKSKGLSPVKNWVDDYVFFRFPISSTDETPSFSYSLNDVYDLASWLEWPWKPSKTRPFASEFKYLGFMWNLSTKTFQIPSSKKTRYLTKLNAWLPGQNSLEKKLNQYWAR